ncbi:unnamed protein product [Trifolium pratense]|uniref:Uncharacterized protein n=1 Tax=Trifolium pratense TaxID=57577 RepID=A0ACB0KSB1_TRIPR|nr:unnamed protein product [Trifolium pratense]
MGVAFNIKLEIYYLVHLDNGTATLKSDFSMRLNRSGLYIQYQVISAHNVPYTSRKARHELDIVPVLQLQGNFRVCGRLAKA